MLPEVGILADHFSSYIAIVILSGGVEGPRRLRSPVNRHAASTLTVHVLSKQAMPHHLEFEHWVPFPLERVFAFFSNPENLPLLMPAATETRLDELIRIPPPPDPTASLSHKAAGVGSTLVTSFRLAAFLPFRKRWIARITEFEWNRYF